MKLLNIINNNKILSSVYDIIEKKEKKQLDSKPCNTNLILRMSQLIDCHYLINDNRVCLLLKCHSIYNFQLDLCHLLII